VIGSDDIANIIEQYVKMSSWETGTRALENP
jgi:hypothetical protein